MVIAILIQLPLPASIHPLNMASGLLASIYSRGTEGGRGGRGGKGLLTYLPRCATPLYCIPSVYFAILGCMQISQSSI